MLFRFCLYGFLKNQQYYDPFLILAFRQKGLSFGMIGALIGFREICINLMEIPTGAIADVMGRRRSMIASFVAYIVAFIVFGLCQEVWTLFLAMFFFSIGEAFRTGTHKAIIFDWLERQGRTSEKISVYGRTRSWAKLGSAASVVIATVLVFTTEQYVGVFLCCIIPYVINIVNFLGYPAYLDGSRDGDGESRSVLRTLLSAVSQSLRVRPLRRLLFESMGYEGVFSSCKDYIQPIIKAACVSLPLMLALGERFGLEERQRVALGIGLMYFVLHLLSSFASRGANSFVERFGGEVRSARLLWLLELLVFAAMAAGILAGQVFMTVIAFLLLALFQNFWRPIFVSRIASHAGSTETATVLSIDSQAKSLFIAIVAPLLGWSVDLVTSSHPDLRFLPVAALGLVVSCAMLLTGRRA